MFNVANETAVCILSETWVVFRPTLEDREEWERYIKPIFALIREI